MSFRTSLARPFVSNRRLAEAAKDAWLAQHAFEALHPVEHDPAVRLRALRERVRHDVGLPVEQKRLDLALASAEHELAI